MACLDHRVQVLYSPLILVSSDYPVCNNTIKAKLLVRHLTDADNILILEKGRVIEQRSSDRLEHTNGHIQSLLAEDAAIALANNVEAQSSPILLDRNTPEDSDVPQISNNNQTLKRSGETALYQYYFQSIGWVYGILGLGLSALSTFFIVFPRKFAMSFSLPYETV